MVYIGAVNVFWKVCVLLLSFIKGVMRVCSHECIYKVVFNYYFYLRKNNYLPTYVCLSTYLTTYVYLTI